MTTINLLVHITLLFTFLLLLFKFLISNKESETSSRALKKEVKNQTIVLLDSINSFSNNTYNIDWDQINTNVKKFASSGQFNKEFIERQNKKTLNTGWFILVALLITTVVYAIIFRKIINFLDIAIDNIVVFSVVGLFEIYFFLNIVLKYIPIFPSDIGLTVLERLKNKL